MGVLDRLAFLIDAGGLPAPVVAAAIRVACAAAQAGPSTASDVVRKGTLFAVLRRRFVCDDADAALHALPAAELLPRLLVLRLVRLLCQSGRHLAAELCRMGVTSETKRFVADVVAALEVAPPSPWCHELFLEVLCVTLRSHPLRLSAVAVPLSHVVLTVRVCVAGACHLARVSVVRPRFGGCAVAAAAHAVAPRAEQRWCVHRCRSLGGRRALRSLGGVVLEPRRRGGSAQRGALRLLA